MVEIQSAKEGRKVMDEMFATIRYHPKTDIKLDKHGMPIVAPEPHDPDEADDKGWG